MKFSNEVEKYETEVTKMGQNNSLFLTVIMLYLHQPCTGSYSSLWRTREARQTGVEPASISL